MLEETTASTNGNIHSRSTSYLPLLYSWKKEMDFLQLELNFYIQLLKYGTLNCTSGNRNQLESLMAEFSEFQKKLASLLALYEELETKIAPPHGLTTKLQKRLIEAEIHFRKLKLKVFKDFILTQKVIIW